MDGGVSECSRAGGSKHDVCDWKSSPTPAKESHLKRWVFYFKTGRTRSVVSADQGGGKGDREVAVSERNRAGGSKHDVCDWKPSPTPANQKGLSIEISLFFILNW